MGSKGSRHSVSTDSLQPHGDEVSPSSVPRESEPLPASVPDISTHYTIFPATFPHGPPPGSPFDIPLASLRREFIALQSLVHPDKSPLGPAKQRAEVLSAQINEAYRTLSDPLARAQYLLAYQHGIDVTAEDGAKVYPQDQETLMKVLEVQEAVEEAAEESTIAELKQSNEERVKECVMALGAAVDQNDVECARRECVKLRFWYSVREGLREWEPGNTSVRLTH